MSNMSLKQLKAGKHSCIGHLSLGTPEASDSTLMEKKAMLVYCGSFDSMDGPVEVTEEHIDRLIGNHNSRLERISRLSTAEDEFVRAMPPLQVDHSTSAMMTVGRVVGRLSKGSYTLEDGTTVACLSCDRVRVLGEENQKKVADGRWSNISIGADLEAGILNELSITPFPAAPHASLLSKNKLSSETQQGEKMETKEEMKARHLAEKEALSAQHGQEAMGHKLEETKVKHEEQMRALMEKHAGELKKLGVDPEKDEANKENLSDDVKEEEKKLAAARKVAIVNLAKGFNKQSKDTRLAARNLQANAKLSRLRAERKITPAEQKKELARLSKISDAELKGALESYANREPVIDDKIHGTTRAVNLATLQKKAKLARLEAETKQDLGMPMDDKDKKALSEELPKLGAETAVTDSKDEHMSQLAAMLGEYDQRDAVMAHVKKMMGYGEQMSSEVSESDEKQMSALAENVNHLQTKFQDLIKLIGDATGIEAAELTE